MIVNAHAPFRLSGILLHILSEEDCIHEGHHDQLLHSGRESIKVVD